MICEASGTSKKESQQNASRIAFEIIQSNKNFMEELRLAIAQTIKSSDPESLSPEETA